LDSEIAGVSIYNLLGQEVLRKSINARQDKIDVSELSSGTYIIKVLTQEGTTVNKKITKQ